MIAAITLWPHVAAAHGVTRRDAASDFFGEEFDSLRWRGQQPPLRFERPAGVPVGQVVPGGFDGSRIIRRSQAGIVGQPLASDAWHSTGVRPDNLPRRRIGQFAAIMARLAPMTMLFHALSPAC